MINYLWKFSRSMCFFPNENSWYWLLFILLNTNIFFFRSVVDLCMFIREFCILYYELRFLLNATFRFGNKWLHIFYNPYFVVVLSHLGKLSYLSFFCLCFGFVGNSWSSLWYESEYPFYFSDHRYRKKNLIFTLFLYLLLFICDISALFGKNISISIYLFCL